VAYKIDTDGLHAGKNYGRISVSGIYGEEVIPVSVVMRTNRQWADGISWKRDFRNFASLYIRQEIGEYERNLLLNSMQTALSRAHATAVEPGRVRLYQADVALLQEKGELARQFLGEVREEILDEFLAFSAEMLYSEFSNQGLDKAGADAAFEETYGSSIEDYLRQTFESQLDVDSLLNEMTTSGKYETYGDKLYMAESGEDIDKSAYDIFTISGDTLKLELPSGADPSEGEILPGLQYPLEFKKAN